MKLTCPNCGEQMKAVFCRLSGISPHGHRHRRTGDMCRLVVVVGRDFEEPTIIVLRDGDDPAVIIQQQAERLLQHGVNRLLAS